MPKKARTAREYPEDYNSVLTFFRKGKLRKTFLAIMNNAVEEVPFFRAAEILEADPNTKQVRGKLDAEFYKHLETNKKEFDAVFTDAEGEIRHSGGSEPRLIKLLRAIERSPEFTDDDEDYIHKVLQRLKEGAILKATSKKLVKETKGEINPLKILAKVKSGIAPEFLEKRVVTGAADVSGPKEVILSEYLMKGK